MPAAKKEVKMTMAVEKETKTMTRFREGIDEKPITLYLRKSDVEALGNPEDIEVIIRAK